MPLRHRKNTQSTESNSDKENQSNLNATPFFNKSPEHVRVERTVEAVELTLERLEQLRTKLNFSSNG